MEFIDSGENGGVKEIGFYVVGKICSSMVDTFISSESRVGIFTYIPDIIGQVSSAAELVGAVMYIWRDYNKVGIQSMTDMERRKSVTIVVYARHWQ